MNKNILRDNIIFWSRLGFCYDPTIFDDNGKPVIFNEDLSEVEYHKEFYKNGIKIHSFILHSGWVGVDKYDYTLTDKVMETAASIGEDVLLMPRIKLNVPIDWCEKYPEEVFVYHNGPQTPDEIRSLVGTLKQDYLGYEAPNGYYMGNPKYNRPNVGGLISLQSFSSEKWLQDAQVALIKLINRLEEKYGDKIIGYHLGYGACGETILWGRDSERYGDYGITNQKMFQKYLEENYGQNNAIPDINTRYNKKDTLVDFLRVDNKVSVIYDKYMSEVNATAAEFFCKTVKEIVPQKLTGIFYGYFMGVHNISYTGHTEIDKLLQSPYVDFFAAPKVYFRCSPGDSGGEYCATQSINMKKTWVDECDVRTHLAYVENSKWSSKNITETRNALTRELSKNISHNSGFWFMDLGGGWYNSPDMLELVNELNKINIEIRSKEHKDVSDVLVLVDENSLTHTSISAHSFQGYAVEFMCNFKKSGALADVYRYADIKNLDLNKYKLIIFAYTLKLTEEDIAYIKSKTNASFMFNYAPGCIKDGKLSLENSKKITGFNLTESDVNHYDFPNTKIVGDESVITSTETGTLATKTIDNRLHFMNTIPYLDVSSIRKVAQNAGCHLYCEKEHVLYGDNRFLTILTDENPYKGTIDFGEEKSWHNAVTGEKGKGKTTEIDLQPYGTAIFIFE